MKVNTTYKGLKTALNEIKASRGLKGAQVAKMAEISPSHLSTALSGHTQLSFNAIAKLSIVLEKPISELCEVTEL